MLWHKIGWFGKTVIVAILGLAAFYQDVPPTVNSILEYLGAEMENPTYEAQQEAYLIAASFEFEFSGTQFQDVEVLRVDFSTEEFPNESYWSADILNENGAAIEMPFDAPEFNISDEQFVLIRKGEFPTFYGRIRNMNNDDQYCFKIENIQPHRSVFENQ